MAQTRHKFDAKFRAGAVRIVTETGKPIGQIHNAHRPTRDVARSSLR